VCVDGERAGAASIVVRLSRRLSSIVTFTGARPPRGHPGTVAKVMVAFFPEPGLTRTGGRWSKALTNRVAAERIIALHGAVQISMVA